MKNFKAGLLSFIHSITDFTKEFGTAVIKGDFFVKLSLIWAGAGYLRQKQIIKSVIVTLIELAVIAYSALFAPKYISKFSTLGTVKQESVFNIVTMKTEFNDYDHSFLILLISIITIIVWITAFILWMRNEICVYRLSLDAKEGRHINSFREDLRELVNSKFHITLLFLPVLGIIIFTVIPLLVMIFVAFTNYDQNHMPPSSLFTWTGLTNFINLFGGGLTLNFGYAFVRILSWTLIWAFFATTTNYIGGILLSLLINNKKTRKPKLWRFLFIITIAVPQFVSLLLVRNFFADNGIVNTLLANIGFTEWLHSIGLIRTNFIPFLTAPGWAHVMIILINIWVGVPYQMLIATGVLMNIPSEQLESARIDGASPRQIFWHITMPYMLFVTGPTLVTDFVKNINNFNVIYLLTANFFVTTNQTMAGAQAKETDLLVTWLFTLTQDYYNYKMASVIGIVVFVICAFFTLIAFNRMIKGDREEMFQ